MKRLHLAVPGPLDQRSGGYLYDARMVSGLRSRGWTVEVHELEGTFPEGDARARSALSGTLEALTDGSLVVIDGLALGGLPGPVREAGKRLRILALVHHPLCDETGRTEQERDRFADTERRALESCTGVITTSAFTADRVHRLFGVSRERLRVVKPGTAPAKMARGPESDAPPRLASVGSVIPRKGYDLLVSALASLTGHPWEWVVAGSLTADPEFAGTVRTMAREADPDGRIEFRGEVDGAEVDALLRDSSLFVLPSHYEGYGMALTEALVRGLPVVSTRGGAIPYTVPDDAGILVPPGDADALREALAELLGPGGAQRRKALAERARHHGRKLPDWNRAVEIFAEAVLELADPAPAAADFDADWLSLREPVDHRARAPELLPPLHRWWRARTGQEETGSGRAGRVVDLGSGTGSNLRYLAPRLPGPQTWTLVDRDPELLDRARGELEDVTLRTVTADLSVDGLATIGEADLVTGSALLDLVSREWLVELVDRCRASGCAALFALTYDGGLDSSRSDGRARPGGPDDELVRDAVNAHQRRDKGFGPALGPDAAPVAERLFDEAGYRTRLAPSVWELGDADRALALRLLEGWVTAAVEERPERAGQVRDWADRRRSAVRAGGFRLRVHHLDLLAIP